MTNLDLIIVDWSIVQVPYPYLPEHNECWHFVEILSIIIIKGAEK